MYIKNLQLNNFRNYSGLNLDFSPSINVIYGSNGYGKTNLLEAMFLCCIGKSFRTSHDTEMIMCEKDDFTVRLELAECLSSFVSFNLNRKKVKSICIDGDYVDRIRFLLGRVNGILFSPETLKIVTEGPLERRSFINIALCQLSSDYYYSLYMYEKSCEEKNKILESNSNDNIMMDVLNEKIVTYGSNIILKRYEFLKELSKFSEEFYNIISSEKEKLDIFYHVSLPSFYEVLKNGNNENVSRETISEYFKKDLSNQRNIEREKENKKCMIGPHRDDFDILLNGLSIKSFGSQGQKRSSVISLKLGELEIMKSVSGKTPILFLDDVLSELDNVRKMKIIELTKGIQTFFTCAEKSDFSCVKEENVNFIMVENLR